MKKFTPGQKLFGNMISSAQKNQNDWSSKDFDADQASDSMKFMKSDETQQLLIQIGEQK